MKPSKADVSYHAKIANSSYIQPSKRAFYVKTYLKNLVYDADVSNEYFAVLLDTKKKILYLSIRGTELNRGFKIAFEDLITDLAVSLRKVDITKRYKYIESELIKLKSKYPSYTIKLVGHSLGASVAHELSKKYDLESHNFNTGSGVRSLKDFRPNSDNSKIYFYHTPEFDALSKSSEILQGEHYYVRKKKDKAAHSLANFYLDEATE